MSHVHFIIIELIKGRKRKLVTDGMLSLSIFNINPINIGGKKLSTVKKSKTTAPEVKKSKLTAKKSTKDQKKSKKSTYSVIAYGHVIVG